MSAAFYADRAEHDADPAERQRFQSLLDLMTPVCKAFCTDVGHEVATTALQVFGGYGYIREFGIEQIVRDVKIASIYEGTNGIQAMDLLGRKMRQNGGALVMAWMQEVNSFVAQHGEHPELGGLVKAVDEAKNQFGGAAMTLAARGAQDPELTLFSATPLLRMLGEVEVARLLVQQALIADLKRVDAPDEERRFYKAKIQTARFFVAQVLPLLHARATVIQSGDRSALDIVF